jgi:hypothetical protein
MKRLIAIGVIGLAVAFGAAACGLTSRRRGR